MKQRLTTRILVLPLFALLLGSEHLRADVVTQFDYPGAGNSALTAISGSNVVGYYDDSSGSGAFLYNGATFTSISPPGTVQTQPLAVSGNSVAGYYYLASNGSNANGFFFNGSSYTMLTPAAGAIEIKGTGV